MTKMTVKSNAALLDHARSLGLEKLADHYSEDLLVAARVAEKLRASFVANEDLTAEIWPVMTVKEQ